MDFTNIAILRKYIYTQRENGKMKSENTYKYKYKTATYT